MKGGERTRTRDRTRRGDLQRLLGDLGTVLPRQAHGTSARRAQGWYARLDAGPRKGETVFLGDYVSVSGLTINELLAEAQTNA